MYLVNISKIMKKFLTEIVKSNILFIVQMNHLSREVEGLAL